MYKGKPWVFVILMVIGAIIAISLNLSDLLTGTSSTEQSTNISVQFTEPAEFVYIGKPNGTRVEVYRMVTQDNRTCYVAWGGTGTAIACPTTEQSHAETLNEVTFTNLGIPPEIKGAVYTLRDGANSCTIAIGGTDIDLSCD